MGFSLIIFLAFGLAMDAFAVSVTNGMCYRIPLLKNALYSGLSFGIAQAAMPLIGYLAGHSFSNFIGDVDHWIALILLSLIGGKMVLESRQSKGHSTPAEKKFSGRVLLLQAVATSIDALAVGVSLGMMQVDLALAVGAIGCITFSCSFCGVIIGKRFGKLLQDKAELLGGVILILIGLHIFLEHIHH